MSEKHDIDKLKAFVSALDDLVGLGEDVMSDGKLDIADIMHIGKVAPILNALYESWKHKDELILEVKDLSWEEVKELIGEVID